jgi:hypothetical protein
MLCQGVGCAFVASIKSRPPGNGSLMLYKEKKYAV